MGDELVLEVVERRPQPHRRAVAQRAERVAENRPAQVLEKVDVPRRALARLDPAQHLDRPVQPLAARGALAAGFFVEEGDDPPGDLDHAGRVVDHDHAGGTEHRADGGEGVEIHADVEPAFRDQRRRDPTGDHCLDLAAGRRAAGMVLDQFAQRDSHGQLIEPGLLHLAAEAIELGAGALLGADLAKPVGASQHDMRDAGEGLDVVDHGRAGVEPLDGRERRLQARLRAFSLHRVKHRRLLAADIGAGAAVDMDDKIEIRAEDTLAEIALGVGLGDRLLKRPGRQHEFAADVDIGGLGPDRKSGDRHALDQLMRIAFHENPVLEGPRLALVGVAAQIFRLVGLFGHETPFEPGRKAGPASAAEI